MKKESKLYIKHWQSGKWLLSRITDISVLKYINQEIVKKGPWLTISARGHGVWGLHPMKGEIRFEVRYPRLIAVRVDLTKKLKSYVDFEIKYESTTATNSITASAKYYV